MEFSVMDVDKGESTSRVPNGASPGNFKAVAPIRIPQACDRCRIKKAKCDGGNPCGRCHISDSLCVFGEKIKANRTVYPKGYVEMLERQQTQLVAGLQALYRKLIGNEPWDDERLPEYDNRPRTQDILAALGLVHPPKHADSQVEEFQEHFPRIGCDDIDTNDQNLVSDFSNAENQPSAAPDYLKTVQIDGWEPSFEIEPADLLEVNKDDWNQEKEAAFLQSLESTLPTAVPSRPEAIPQDCVSMNFVDPLLYRPEWVQEEVCNMGSSIPPLSLPAHLQSFEFNVDPMALSTKGTYARRQQPM